jgi:hypothetical protein
MGYAATSAISTSDGETMYAARRRSEIPRERRPTGVPVVMDAASISWS